MFKKVFAVLWLNALFVAGLAAQERLVLIGGGGRPVSVLTKFVEFGGDKNGKILVVTWASGEPQESFAAFRDDLAKVSAVEIENAPIAPLSAQTRIDFLQQLKEATGIFFTGGDQNRVMEVLKDTELLNALKAKYKSGAVFGGTSAGTAIMSQIMITGEGDLTVIDGAKIETRSGLGLLTEAIVDQHFIKRQRENRLLGLILQNPQLLGIGIDEATAFVVRDNRYGEVLGNSQVVIFDAHKTGDAMRLYLLKNGEKFDLKKRKKIK